MGGNVLRLERPTSPSGGWTNEELAELYRVEHSLFQAGLAVETECGVSDEGDPWFVFCHVDGNVVVHAARIDGLYYLYSASLPAPLTGRSFGAIAKTFAEKVAKTRTAAPSGRVVAHPSALLSLLVAASVLSIDAVLHNSAHASELSSTPHNHVSASDPSPKAPDTTLARELADIFFSAVWRNSEGSDEREAILQAVENAAVGLCALSVALPLVRASVDLSSSELTQGIRPLPEEGVETSDEPRRPILADAVGASSSSSAAMNTVAGSTVALTVLRPVIEAPNLLASWENAFSEEGATFSALSGMPAINASIGVGAFSSPHEKTLFSSTTLSLIPADGILTDITPTSHGEAIDLNGYATGTVRIIVSGGGALTVTHASAVQSIEVAEGVKAELTLSYVGSPSAAPVHQTLRLDGATDVSLKSDSNPTVAAATPTVDLVVDSQGAQTNNLNLVATGQDPSTELNINVVGSQDLALNESAATAASSTLDASSLTGKLALGIDFGSGGITLTDLNLGSSNLVVTPQDSVAIVNLPFSNAQIELGLNLDTVTFGYNDQPTADESTELNIVLGNAGVTPSSVIIGGIDAAEVNSLTIISNDAENIVHNIIDSALTSLVLSGPTSLEIDAIGGIAASNTQNIVIDATSLAGNLILNVSGIVDTVVGGRQVQIDTGSGHSIVSDTAYTETLNFTIGSGNAIVNIGSGAEQITITGLKPTDQVNVGSVGVVDLFTNGLGTLVPHQGAIDASSTLDGAAALAASFAESKAAHEALLFSYRGNAYVFVDALGNHVFNPSADAIVKLIGATLSTELSGVFHSS